MCIFVSFFFSSLRMWKDFFFFPKMRRRPPPFFVFCGVMRCRIFFFLVKHFTFLQEEECNFSFFFSLLEGECIRAP